MICLKNLCFKANRREILSELSLRVKPGEQLNKLMSLGLTQLQAESQIVNGFLK